MATYLVTGGAGFIGSHLCEALLTKNHQVYVLDNLSTGNLANLDNRVEFIEGDIQNLSLFSSILNNVDGCFHLAAVASVSFCNDHLLKAHEVNATGVLNAIESVRRVAAEQGRKIPLVFASSSAVYGDNHDLPHHEQAQTLPISTYGAQKLIGEYYGRCANDLFDMSYTILRLFNVYGPRQNLASDYSGVISIFLNNLCNDKHLTIYGDGKQSRDFVYVKDVANFFIKAMETATPSVRTYNVCAGHSISVSDIAKLLGKILEKEIIIAFKPAKIGEVYRSIGSPTIASNELGVAADTPLETGLELLVEAFLAEN